LMKDDASARSKLDSIHLSSLSRSEIIGKV
jgi:hypothetical protein